MVAADPTTGILRGHRPCRVLHAGGDSTMTTRSYFRSGTDFRPVDRNDIEEYRARHQCGVDTAKVGCNIERLDEIRRELRMQISYVPDAQTRKCLTLIALTLEIL